MDDGLLLSIASANEIAGIGMALDEDALAIADVIALSGEWSQTQGSAGHQIRQVVPASDQEFGPSCGVYLPYETELDGAGKLLPEQEFPIGVSV